MNRRRLLNHFRKVAQHLIEVIPKVARRQGRRVYRYSVSERRRATFHRRAGRFLVVTTVVLEFSAHINLLTV